MSNSIANTCYKCYLTIFLTLRGTCILETDQCATMAGAVRRLVLPAGHNIHPAIHILIHINPAIHDLLLSWCSFWNRRPYHLPIIGKVLIVSRLEISEHLSADVQKAWLFQDAWLRHWHRRKRFTLWKCWARRGVLEVFVSHHPRESGHNQNIQAVKHLKT